MYFNMEHMVRNINESRNTKKNYAGFSTILFLLDRMPTTDKLYFVTLSAMICDM